MSIEVEKSDEGLPLVTWVECEPIMQVEPVQQILIDCAVTGFCVYLLFSYFEGTIYSGVAVSFGVLASLFLGLPVAFIAHPIRRNARYAKLSRMNSKPKLLQRKPVFVMTLDVKMHMFVVNFEEVAFLGFYPPLAISEVAKTKSDAKFVELNDVVDFSIHTGNTWMNFQGVDFHVLVMRLRDNSTKIVAVHFGGQALLFQLQQTLTREFVTNRPGSTAQKLATRKRPASDII